MRVPYFQKIQQFSLDEGQLPLFPVVGGGVAFVVLGVRQGVQRRVERLVGVRSSLGDNDPVGLPQPSVGHRNGQRRATAQGEPDES